MRSIKVRRFRCSIFLFLVSYFLLSANGQADWPACASTADRRAELDLGLSFHSGVDQKQMLNAAFNAERAKFSFSARVNYAEKNDDVSEDHGYVRLGYDPMINDKWSLWFYEQAGYNRKREIRLENFAGGGPKYSLFDNEQLKASLSVGLLQHHIEYENDDTDDLARASFRLKSNWQISKSIVFSFVAFYQPDIEDYQDYIITGEAGLRFRLTGRIGLKLKIEDEYRSVTRVDENNAFTTMLALSINFYTP